MKFFIYILLLTISNFAFAQAPEVKKGENTADSMNYIFNPGAVNQPATYPEGQAKLMSLIAEIPTSDLLVQNMTNSKLILEFVIEKDGSTSNFKVMKSVQKEYDQKVIEVLESMTFNPAQVDRKVVRSSYVLPVQICFD